MNTVSHQTIYVDQNQYFVVNQPTQFVTVLGSCVSVCLYDPIHKVAAMNHFVMPTWNGQGVASPKYGDISMKHMIRSVFAKGASALYINARVFGGAKIVEGQQNAVGDMNVEVAMQALLAHRISIHSVDTGGLCGRRLEFDSLSGEIKCESVERFKG